MAYWEAEGRQGEGAHEVPLHIRNAPQLMKASDTARATNTRTAMAATWPGYLPEASRQEYYQPTENGYDKGNQKTAQWYKQNR